LKTKIGDIDFHLESEMINTLKVLSDVLDSKPLDELSQQLSIEYTRLFRGIQKGYGPPPPYESIYRGERRVIGEVTLDVINMYRQANFTVIDETAGPQDYLGTELKFMSYLCHDEMNAWKQQHYHNVKRFLNLEHEFLEKHLLLLVPPFTRKIVTEAREKFYLSIVRLTDEFTTMDFQIVTYLLTQIPT
jgi:TorA maturation chaperone TorD